VELPALNATLNGTSAILLFTGRTLIKRQRVEAHRNFMIAALISSSAFLTSYLYYHFVVHTGVTRFRGTGIIRAFYFTLLGSHTILAAAIVPLIVITFWRGWRRQDVRHRAIARWTYPLWMYVSVTGVVIYLMLYKLPV
jgi:uncharacterized membrane protein YozB (DUF420 family)